MEPGKSNFSEMSECGKFRAHFYYLGDDRIENGYLPQTVEKMRKNYPYLMQRQPPFGPKDFIGLKRYSTSELKHMTGDFSEDNFIQQTIEGKLFRGEIQQEGSETKVVTVKAWRVMKGRGANVIRFDDEVNFLTNAKFKLDPRLVDALGICVDDKLAVVYDLKFRKSLYELIPLDDFGWDCRMKIASELADLLAALHKENIALCIFSPACVHVDENYNVKLFDLAHLTRFEDMDDTIDLKFATGETTHYAVEWHQGSKLSGASDVYSFGVLLLELISKTIVLDFILARHREEEHFSADYSCGCVPVFLENWKGSLVHESFSEATFVAHEVEMLVKKCLNPDPKSRVKMEEVVKDIKQLEAKRKRRSVFD